MSSQVLKQSQVSPPHFVTCGAFNKIKFTICVRLWPSLPKIKPGIYAQALTVFDDTDDSASQILLSVLATDLLNNPF